MSKNNNNFKSSMIYPTNKVKEILKKKINEEKEYILENTKNNAIKEEKNLYNKVVYKPDKINILSLFSGAGGLDMGVEMAAAVVTHGEQNVYSKYNNEKNFKSLLNKTNIVYSNDIFEAANITYENNFIGEYVKDSRNIKKVISFPKSDIILGGFPCPGFSVAGPRLLDDPRNFLYIHYIRALMESKPKIFIAENVKGLMTMGHGEVLKQITEDFSAAGYQVTANLVNSRDYGVPQSRERVFIVGIRNDIYNSGNFKYIVPKHTNGPGTDNSYVTLKDAISDLPAQPEDVFDSSYSYIYMSRNRKKSWNDQSFTIQASGRQAPQYPGGEPMSHVGKNEWKFNGKFNRRLSVREVARIQTFPDWFKFSKGSKSNSSKNNKLNLQYKQIGNAVPVFLAEKMARPIMEYLLKNLDK